MAYFDTVDMGGQTILCQDIRTGAAAPGQNATTAKSTAAGSTKTLTRSSNLGRNILLDTATGSVVTLPAALGSGDTYDFLITTTATSNNHIIKVGNGTDTFVGYIFLVGAATAFASDVAGGTDDTLTMNGTTTGGAAGSRISVQDVAAGKWYISGVSTGSSTLATGGFSATVS